jgi:hypothetical protein
MRYVTRLKQIRVGEETYVMPDFMADELYVIGIHDDEADIMVPEYVQIEMLRNELENLKRRVSELEKAVMPRATA